MKCELGRDVIEAISSGGGCWRPVSGASPQTIAALQLASPIPLPSSYFDLLRISDGGEGDLGIDPGWICVWPAAEVIERNLMYEINTHLPGFFGFGSNGGGELLAFDARSGFAEAIVMAPFISLDVSAAIKIARDFNELVGFIGKQLLEVNSLERRRHEQT